MPLSRGFRESAASGRGEMRVLVIAGEPIYANVRLRLTANRTYGLSPVLVATRERRITSACAKYYDVELSHNDLVNIFFSRYFHDPPLAHNVELRVMREQLLDCERWSLSMKHAVTVCANRP